jgi:hypothetical protein
MAILQGAIGTSGERQSDAPFPNVILRMIEPHYHDSLPVFDYNKQLLSETQINLPNLQKGRVERMYPPSHSFTDLVQGAMIRMLFRGATWKRFSLLEP